MSRCQTLLCFVWTFVLGMLPGTGLFAEDVVFSADQLEFFEKQVRPLLIEHCQSCHGAEKQKGGLRLDSREALLLGGESGAAVVPGKPDDSELIRALRYDPEGYQMPPEGKLPPEALAVFEKWVEMGTPWPVMAGGGKDRLAPTGADEFAKRAERWSFQPLQRTALPAVKNEDWSRTPIDRFLLAKLEEAGLLPALEADRRTWIRRVYFDTIGLPPAPEAVEAFVADESPDAFERVVDELLASPRFGERWGRHWLDLARYAESRGHEFDYDIPNPWHYRDYVIRALNEDVPYDQFVVEHMAGDRLGEGRETRDVRRESQEGARDKTQPTSIAQPSSLHSQPFRPRFSPTGANESLLATGFWYLGEWVHSPVDIRKDETERVDNMLEVYGKTFLGLTVACARCHDHKFDPISQKDYYALAGYLKSTSYAQRPFESLDQNRRIQQQLRELSARAHGPIEEVTRKAALPVLSQMNHVLLAVRELLASPLESPDSAAGSVAFEDFESGTYDSWELTGDAFGAGPQTPATIGDYQGNVQAHGQFFVNSHQLRDGGRGDDHVGTLTSREFTIEHDTLRFLIGGGSHVGRTCINLLIDGKVVLSATGHSSNQMRSERWNLQPFRGQKARLQIVDDERGGWGNIGIDQLVFQDAPASQVDSPEFAARVEQLATERGISASVLKNWVEHAVRAAADPADPFHRWAKFAVGQAPYPADEPVVETPVPASAQLVQILAQDGVYYSLPTTAEGSRVWLTNDPSRPISPLVGHGSVALVDPDFASVKDRDGTMRDGGSLAGLGRAGRTLRTASFEITTGRIAAWVRGGCATYVVVDSHALVLGPLHGSLVRKQNATPEWHWIEHDVTRYKGHVAHLEIVAEAGTDFACEAVYQVEQLPPPRTPPDAVHLLNLDLAEPLPASELSWMLNHPALFELDAPQVRQQLDLVSRPYIEQRQELVEQIVPVSAAAPAMLDGTATDEQLLIRGNSNKANGTVPRRFIEVFHGQTPQEAETGSGRMGLALQMVNAQQTPIVPRVIVNRIWHHYFGRGIVPTTDDFGHMGQLPSHPELLDWLATELVRDDWSQKQIHRVILLSAAYRMTSDEGADAASSPPTSDPNNVLLHRMNLKRLEGEIIRDSLLSLSGRSDDRLYGPSVPIALNAFQDGRGKPGVSGPIDGAGRRSLYLSVRRNFSESFLTVFDLPNPHTSVGRRSVSNVPAQALALLNSPMVMEQAKLWAEQSLRTDPQLSTPERIDHLYQQAFSRRPSAEERSAAVAFVETTPGDAGGNAHDPQPWIDLCHILWNTKEFIYIR